MSAWRADLCQRPALADGNDVSNLDTERRRAVCCYVLVPLLVTIVFRDVVEAAKAKLTMGLPEVSLSDSFHPDLLRDSA